MAVGDHSFAVADGVAGYMDIFVYFPSIFMGSKNIKKSSGISEEKRLCMS